MATPTLVKIMLKIAVKGFTLLAIEYNRFQLCSHNTKATPTHPHVLVLTAALRYCFRLCSINMPDLRGINVHAVSHIDAGRLPEYGTAQAFDSDESSTACYIPTIPGAQLWFEYSIDGPHPPDAAYFFKMLMNAQFVTGWVCKDRDLWKTSSNLGTGLYREACVSWQGCI